MNYIDLFTGIGGLSMGFNNAGFNPMFSIEIDGNCYKTINNNVQNSIFTLSDHDLQHGDIKDHSFYKYCPEVDVITGGPPCQPFSLGGQHKSRHDNRNMFPEAIRSVRQAKPKAFLFENVKGLTRERFANYYEYIKLQLTYPGIIQEKNETWLSHLKRLETIYISGNTEELQYNVIARVLNAADYGIPQRRERVFIVGFRHDLNCSWHFPTPTHSLEALLWSMKHGEYYERLGVSPSSCCISPRLKQSVSKIFQKPQHKPWVTVREALQDLPKPMLNEGSPRYSSHIYKPGAKKYTGHTGSPLDEPSKTLKAGNHGVPGGENMMRYRDGSVRYFTIRECARIQSFPDNYVFSGTWSETIRQIGNAVPVRLSEILATSIKAALI